MLFRSFLNKAGIDTGTGVEIADSLVFSCLSTFIGKPAFEEICMQYIIRQNKAKRLPFLATNFGIWWGNDKKEKKNADFDIVADNKTDSEILLGECKWRNETPDIGEIENLLSKKYLMPGYKKHHFIFFSKVPYSKTALKLEHENPNLKLITLEDLFSID